MKMIKNLQVLGFAVAALISPIVQASEAFWEQEEEVEVVAGAPFERNIEVKVGGDLIVEFKAWYRSTVPAGFYSTLNVVWNGDRITRILDRPDAVFVEGLERELPIRSDTGWLTAILPHAEAAGQPSRYYIPLETLDVVTYRFKVSVEKPGIYPLAISSSLRDPENKYYDTLVVSNLRVYPSDE